MCRIIYSLFQFDSGNSIFCCIETILASYILSGYLNNYTLDLTHSSENNLNVIYAYFYIILSMININKTDFIYIVISVREYIKFNDLETAD